MVVRVYDFDFDVFERFGEGLLWVVWKFGRGGTKFVGSAEN